jgi:hypothetical protein
MSLSSAVATLTAITAVERELPMPPWAFAAIAFGGFLVLLGVLWSFRNTAAKYDIPEIQHDARGPQHGSPGATDGGAKL